MRFPVVFLLAVSATFAQEHPKSPADIAAGAKMFRSHCAECHGAKGEGGVGPNLTTGVFYHGNSDTDLLQNISDGIAGTAMPGTFFDAVQVSQIVAYLRSLARAGTRNAPPGDMRRGEQLFRSQGCSGCHLVRGDGGIRGPDLSVIGSQRSAEHLREAILNPDADVLPQYWIAKISLQNGTSYSGFLVNEDTYGVQIIDFSQGLKSLPRSEFKTYEMDKKSSMPSYKNQLSPQQVDDLVTYLWSLTREGKSE
jgi:cytochrome c oxidase cbb3-type subunit III